MLPEYLFQYQPLIDQLLAKSPYDRFQNGHELIQEVNDLVTQDTFGSGNPEVTQTMVPIAAETPGRKNGDSLHFDGGNRIRNAVIITLLLLTAGYFLYLRDHPRMVELQTQLNNWFSEQEFSVPSLIPRKRDTSVTVQESSINKLAQKEQSPPTSQPESQEISRLLHLAQDRRSALKLSYPVGDSALYYFREVLKLDPGNSKAKQGLKEIVDWYHEKAAAAMAASNTSLARRYVRRGMSIDNRHKGLLKIHRRLSP
jgi:hypothetical protein